MPSVVDICNNALIDLGASAISSLTEDSKAARLCNQRFDSIRDTVFRFHPWNCLVKRASLAADTDTPAFEYSYQYTLPTDPYCLRVLSLETADFLFKVEGRKILTNETTVNIIYVARVLDTNEYDFGLIETLSAALAASLAYPLIGSVSLSQQMKANYDQKLIESRFVDATEGSPGNIITDVQNANVATPTFINSRF
tara:strand:- start:788 stop:1378 length:591 start_codon:yes stop_codon:yes gene_type:complete